MMRLQVTFVGILLVASASTSLVWRNLDVARDGDAWARLLVFALALVSAVSLVLLGRIVSKARRPGRPAGDCK
jgi:hypothetical protein